MVHPSSLTIRARAEPLTACRPGPRSEDIRPADGAEPTAGLVQKLLLDYRLQDEFSLDRGAPQSLEGWAVAVSALGADQVRSEIGNVRVIIVNLQAGQDVGDFTDRASGLWLDLDGSPVKPTSRVLVLDRVWIRPERRGRGLGPIIAAAVVDRLGRACELAACYPAPFEEGAQGPTRDASIEALGRIWAQVGFRAWGDGVWIIDLSQHDTRAALAALLSGRAVRV